VCGDGGEQRAGRVPGRGCDRGWSVLGAVGW
jgi:hypothetical protein